MTVREALQWLNPFTWDEYRTDRQLALEWGQDDARVPDDVARHLAVQSSLVLLTPITHRRYWSAYDATETILINEARS